MRPSLAIPIKEFVVLASNSVWGRSIGLGLGLLGLLASSSQAQWLGHDYAVHGAPYSNFVASSFLNQTSLNQAAVQGKRAGAADNLSSRVDTTTIVGKTFQPAVSAHQLAQRYNPSQRAQIENAFVQAFEGYQKIEAQFGIPKGDLAGGVAAFIAGNYIAYRNLDFPDKDFPPLVEQIRNALAANPAVAQASVSDKRQAYEQLAMVGMFMAVSREALKRKPDPKVEANFRETARANLEQLLKTDADRLQITERGLVIQ